MSVIKTSFLSYSCFFLLLVEVKLLLEGEGVEGSGGEEGKEDEEGRPLFSLSTYICLVGATSLQRALTSSTSPFRTSSAFSFPYIEGFSPARILRV